ncbi:MAG: DUF418 domain-containing protein [Actinomycetota bacterium]
MAFDVDDTDAAPPRPSGGGGGGGRGDADDGDDGDRRVRSDRLPGPDVVRAVALIGVVVMNYHGYLIIRGGDRDGGALAEFFDPWTGPLGTRFAATFVLVAGVGVTLLTRRVWSPDLVTIARWQLARRGLVLYLLGLLLDRIWPGTIILYYGAMFAIGALLFTLRTRWVLVIGAVAVALGAAISAWIFDRRVEGESVAWLTSPGATSVRGIVFDVFVNGTHPLLPWLGFLCVGIVIGRHLDAPQLHLTLVGAGLVLFAAATLLSSLGSTARGEHLLSTDAGSRSVVYVASALGTALIAFGALSWAAERWTTALDPLRRAGQLSLTIYVAHILLFNLVVDWLDLVQPGGVGTSLAAASVFWIVAIVAATCWHRRFGRGPCERAYRALAG